MDEQRRERLKEVLLLADSIPQERRHQWVEQRLKDDPVLAREALSLLEPMGDGAGTLLDPLVQPPPELRARSVLPERIGPFVIDALLGQGGVANVYRAHLPHATPRSVALKVLRPGRSSAETLVRFDVERQVIARLEHRNIARLLDTGADPDGCPWIAMELVDGPTITEYARLHDLDLAERLALVRQVCEAVQHAHDRGVLHRDIKPSNILVAEEDGVPVPKVIDFGVAKLLAPELGRDARPNDGQMLGTLGYMSPEQCDPRAPDVDVRTDVYSLGVVTYELLTGTLPFPLERLRPLPPPAIHAILSTERAEPPSRRIAGTGLQPGTPGRRLAFRSELDCVVLKSLEPDRSQRYARVGALGEDLERYLRGELVTARPPTPSDVARSFVRRNRALAAAAAVVSTGLVGGSAVLAVALSRAVEERDLARSESERSQRLARDESEFSEYMRSYILDRRLGPDASHREVLLHLRDGLAQAPPELPIVRARIARDLGVALASAGEVAAAGELFADAVRALEDPRLDATYGFDRGRLLIDVLSRHAELAWSTDSIEEAEGLWELARRAASAWPPIETTERVSLATTHVEALVALGAFERAESIADAAFGEAGLLERGHPARIRVQSVRGALLARIGRVDEGLSESAAAVLVPTAQPEDEAATVVELRTIHGRALLRAGRVAEAEAEFGSGVELARDRLGPDHPDTLVARALRARAAARVAATDEHADTIASALARLEALGASAARRSRLVRTCAIDTAIALERFDEALAGTAALVDGFAAQAGANASSTAMLRWELGLLWARTARTDTALELLDRAREDLARALPSDAMALRLLDADRAALASGSR